MHKSHTPYDDVFRTLLNDCSRLIFPMVNEIFQEVYTGTEELRFFPNEHFLNQQDGREKECITDTNFLIKGAAGVKQYHWECQSTPDSSMLVRFFEYDSQIALDHAAVQSGTLSVTFPYSAALFLRCTESTPDFMKIHITAPDGVLSCKIPVMKLQKYKLEEIFHKNLLFLLPFYIFSHESRFQRYETDEKALNDLLGEYAEIQTQLEKLCQEGILDQYTKCTIADMSHRVLEHIAAKYPRVKEGVKSVMVGKVLDYEAKTILNKGRAEGRMKERMELIYKMRKNGYSYEEISKITGIAAESLKEAAEVKAGKHH